MDTKRAFLLLILAAVTSALAAALQGRSECLDHNATSNAPASMSAVPCTAITARRTIKDGANHPLKKRDYYACYQTSVSAVFIFWHPSFVFEIASELNRVSFLAFPRHTRRLPEDSRARQRPRRRVQLAPRALSGLAGGDLQGSLLRRRFGHQSRAQPDLPVGRAAARPLVPGLCRRWAGWA